MRRLPLAVRMYRRCLAWLPAEFSNWREDAQETFHDLYADAQQRGRLAALVCCLSCLGRVFAMLVGEGVERLVNGSGKFRRWPTVLREELSSAFRGARRRVGFSLAVVGVLSLGIGAATSVFSVVDCVLLRPLPYPEADRLVYFDHGAHAGPVFERWELAASSFDKLAAVAGRHLDLTGEGPPLRVAVADISAGFFDLFGAKPQVGRLLTAADESSGDGVVVLSSELWQRRWGGDPAVVGRVIRLEGELLTVVGVIGDEFLAPEALVDTRVDIWRPLDRNHEHLRRWDTYILSVAGRLAGDSSLAAAQLEIDNIAHQLAVEQPGDRLGRDGQARMTPLVPLHQATIEGSETALLILLGAVTLMLLVGCSNVASLFLARGSERRREMALRLVLGAQRRRLAVQLLVESILLSLVGGAAGIALSHGLITAFLRFVPDGMPRFSEVRVDGRVLTVAVFVAVVIGVFFGLAPALQAARSHAAGVFRGGSATAGRGAQRTRSLLVVAEVAMALVLVSGAAMLGNSLVRLWRTDLGFTPAGLTRMAIRLGDDYSEERRLQFARQLLERTESLPEIDSAALGWTLPLDEVGRSRCCWFSGLKTAADQEPVMAVIHPVTPGYLHTLGAELVAGRGIGWQDESAASIPVVLNQTAARQLFEGDSALGQVLRMGEREMQVVGVAEDVKHWGADQQGGGEVYVPFFLFGGDEEELKLVTRSVGGLTPGLAETLRSAVWELDPSLPIADIVTLEQRVSRSLVEPRFFSLLVGSFAFLSLLLAALGLWGTLLYMVNQRRRELGIRLAVGAAGSDLARLVVGQGLVLVAAGLVIGLLGSLALSNVLSSMLFGISPRDPATYFAVCLLLVMVAIVASYLPARRAAHTDPIQTLRAD